MPNPRTGLCPGGNAPHFPRAAECSHGSRRGPDCGRGCRLGALAPGRARLAVSPASCGCSDSRGHGHGLAALHSPHCEPRHAGRMVSCSTEVTGPGGGCPQSGEQPGTFQGPGGEEGRGCPRPQPHLAARPRKLPASFEDSEGGCGKPVAMWTQGPCPLLSLLSPCLFFSCDKKEFRGVLK